MLCDVAEYKSYEGAPLRLVYEAAPDKIILGFKLQGTQLYFVCVDARLNHAIKIFNCPIPPNISSPSQTPHAFTRSRSEFILPRSTVYCVKAPALSPAGREARHMVYPRDVAMAVPLFPRSFRPSNRRKRWIAHVMELAKLATVLRPDSWFLHGIRIFAIWSCGVPCGQSP